MAAVEFDVEFTESRSRLTTFFRGILVIPHLILLNVWQYAVQVVAVIQWFIILFTGRRNPGIWGFTNAWLAYGSRVMAYNGVLYDPYPAFGTDPGRVPVRYSLVDEEPADRLTNGLRIIWAIPAALLGVLVGIAGGILTVVSWVLIVITGKQSRAHFAFLVKMHRYIVRVNAYTTLLTDTYPKYE